MKILAIDDQQLVLLALRKKLSEVGYEVLTANNGADAKAIIDTTPIHLVILDINMPDISGLEMIKYIRKEKGFKVPIVILSGNTEVNTITESFNLGADDYMKKPLSFDEVLVRVKRLIGLPVFRPLDSKPTAFQPESTIIHQRCVGIVIPCYNEEKRLLSTEFLDFVDQHSGYHLCFVNDGSSDQTLEVLQNMQKDREDYVTVYNCAKNGGKAEAVRLGMLHMSQHKDLDYIGFLDADLSTDLSDFDNLTETIAKSDFKIVSGSRISRMGANISKESARQIISLTINFIIRKILGMNFKDTQCGAKIMDREIIDIAFQKKFITRWLFDVEIFMRMKKHYGSDQAQKYICEQPLRRWIHADGSKLSMKDSIKIVFQLGYIVYSYNQNFIQKRLTRKVNPQLKWA